MVLRRTETYGESLSLFQVLRCMEVKFVLYKKSNVRHLQCGYGGV